MKLKPIFLKMEHILENFLNLRTSFDYLRITIASPEKIKLWTKRILPNKSTFGEVVNCEITYSRKNKPENYGLFCEKIFGPLNDWKCQCGKYNGFIVGKICEECDVEITESRVRRYRMGYITLAYPVVHFWYLNGVPNYLTTILSLIYPNITTSDIENIVYFREKSIKQDSSEYFNNYYNDRKSFFSNTIDKKDKINQKINSDSIYLTKDEFKPFLGKSIILNGEHAKGNGIGSNFIKAALESINIEFEINNLRSLLKEVDDNVEKNFSNIKKLRILESFLSTKTSLSWMILTVLPVLPPSLRPIVESEDGLALHSDISVIYRSIIIINKELLSSSFFAYSTLLSFNNLKKLQETIDSLIDNSRLLKSNQIILNNRALKSLTETLEGKEGRFRHTLLGKRVDYSARSVIVVSPKLNLDQCGLPYKIGTELFQPLIVNELLKIKALSSNFRFIENLLKNNKSFTWAILKELIRKNFVLLNRAPTLHRFGIQAFNPILVLNSAILLHPLVCTGFNADFDGDQMAIHLPLYEASQLEVSRMMLPSYNILSPSNGEVIIKPTQDMVIGCHYLTLMITKNKQITQKWFLNEDSVMKAFYQKIIDIHTPILVNYKIFNFLFIIEDRKLKIYKSLQNITFKGKDIIVHKIFRINKTIETLYLITNIGVFVAYLNIVKNYNSIKNKNNLLNTYCLTNLFLETTAGRVLFSKNLEKINCFINKKMYES